MTVDVYSLCKRSNYVSVSVSHIYMLWSISYIRRFNNQKLHVAILVYFKLINKVYFHTYRGYIVNMVD